MLMLMLIKVVMELGRCERNAGGGRSRAEAAGRGSTEVRMSQWTALRGITSVWLERSTCLGSLAYD